MWTIVQECGSAIFTNYITDAPPSHYAVSSIDGYSQSQLCDFQTGVVAHRPIVISSQIGLQTFNVAYGSKTSHLKFLAVNIPIFLIGVSTLFSTINCSFE